MPAFSSAAFTFSNELGVVYAVTRLPSVSTSSAPESIAMRDTSSGERLPASISMMPFCSNSHCTEPDSPSFPPFLVNAARISDAVRLRLSVAASTITETPPGA